ncbi:MAG: glycosyltransferase family 39 protein [Gemmatimonadales bacterium]
MTSSWLRDRAFLAGFAGSVAIKLALALAVRHHAAILDEGAYLRLATQLAAGGGYEGTFRPPGYPAFLAFWLVLGAGTLGVRLAQVALSAWSTVLMYRLGSRVGGERVGRVAGLLFAFDPVLIAFSHRLWSETLFLTILLLILELLSRDAANSRWLQWAVIGGLFGAGALVRPMLITFLPFLALWLVWNTWVDRRSLGWAALRGPLLNFSVAAACCLVVVLPWTLRNQRATGTFVLIDSNGPFNFLVGSQPEAAFVDKDDRWSDRYGMVDGQAYTELVAVDAARAQSLAMQQARANIAAQPGRFLAKSVWEAGHLWTLDSFLLRHLRNDWYGKTLPGWVTPLVTVVAVGFWVGLALAGLAGLFLLMDRPLARFGILWVLQATLLFGATYALSRYSVPLRPFLALGAAGLLAGTESAGARWQRATRPVKLLTVTALLLVAVSWSRDLGLVRDMLVHRGAGHRFEMEQLQPTTEP